MDQRPKPVRVGIICPDEHRKQVRRTAETRLSEFVGLAEAIGLAIAFADIVRVREVRPSTYIGGGQVEEIARRVKDGEIELLLFDAALTPIQQRNLERATGTKVLDRTALILEIFGERARTREGVLQVELAHLNYQKSRLVRSWTHLERQRGGFGFLGGPGETQIESDRRLLQERIALIEKRIDKVRKTRAVQRGPRGAVPFPIVALVGYTNAGKSSLFNTLTGATVEAKNLLFATLDPTVRKLSLSHGREVMLSDTVGFIADLPTDLVAAFRATLEEVVEADIILHVRDISNPDQQAQAADVLDVLAQLGVTPESKPFIEVWNKIDLLSPQNAQDVNVSLVPAGKVAASCRVSALTGQGIPELLLAIETEFASRARIYRVEVPHERGEDVGWLYAHSEVISADEPDETSTRFLVRVEPRNRDALLLRFKGRVTPSDAP